MKLKKAKHEFNVSPFLILYTGPFWWPKPWLSYPFWFQLLFPRTAPCWILQTALHLQVSQVSEFGPKPPPNSSCRTSFVGVWSSSLERKINFDPNWWKDQKRDNLPDRCAIMCWRVHEGKNKVLFRYAGVVRTPSSCALHVSMCYSRSAEHILQESAR